MLPVTKVNSMKQKEIVLTLSLLAEKGASEQELEGFEKWYPSGSATLSEVLSYLQILANTDTEYVKYVDCAKWLFDTFPPTQEPLVLNELNREIIIHNGNLTIKANIAGDHVIIVNGDLNIEGDLNGCVEIWAKNVKAKNITLDDLAEIEAETIDAENIMADDYAEIVAETIKAINIAAYGDSEIWAEKINVQNIMDDTGTRIRGEINLIQHSYN